MFLYTGTALRSAEAPSEGSWGAQGEGIRWGVLLYCTAPHLACMRPLEEWGPGHRPGLPRLKAALTKTILVEIPNSTFWSPTLDIPGSNMVATTVQLYAVLYAAAHLFKHRTKFGNYSPLQTIQNGKTVRPCTLSAPDSCTPDLNGQTLPYIIFDIFVFYGLHIWEKWKKTTQMKRNAKWSIICATKNLKHMWMVISHSGQTACPPKQKRISSYSSCIAAAVS